MGLDVIAVISVIPAGETTLLSGEICLFQQPLKNKVLDASRDIVEFLCSSSTKYNLFIAADVFIYIGDLVDIFRAVERRAAPGAYFVFSTEITREENFVLQKNGRFAHNRHHIQKLAGNCCFTVEVCRLAQIREEYGQWIPGELFVFKCKL